MRIVISTMIPVAALTLAAIAAVTLAYQWRQQSAYERILEDLARQPNTLRAKPTGPRIIDTHPLEGLRQSPWTDPQMYRMR
jgi:hypothetical protein